MWVNPSLLTSRAVPKWEDPSLLTSRLVAMWVDTKVFSDFARGAQVGGPKFAHILRLVPKWVNASWVHEEKLCPPTWAPSAKREKTWVHPLGHHTRNVRNHASTHLGTKHETRENLCADPSRAWCPSGWTKDPSLESHEDGRRIVLFWSIF